VRDALAPIRASEWHFAHCADSDGPGGALSGLTTGIPVKIVKSINTMGD
jgi:hypothetical protein